MVTPVAIDTTEITITPVFKYIEVENVPQSELAGHAVMETREVVEIRFAGSRNYAPTFPAHQFWRREGNRTITYAERWADQYRAFKEGNPQEAMGTPLEMLRQYGITPELISLCRALRIYSIESVYHLEGVGLKSLGMNANRLKDAAREFMAQKNSAVDQQSRIEDLERQIAALRGAGSTVPPPVEPSPEVVEQMIEEADARFAAMSDDDIKEEIAGKVGSRPRGNPSRDTLIRMAVELEAA